METQVPLAYAQFARTQLRLIKFQCHCNEHYWPERILSAFARRLDRHSLTRAQAAAGVLLCPLGKVSGQVFSRILFGLFHVLANTIEARTSASGHMRKQKFERIMGEKRLAHTHTLAKRACCSRNSCSSAHTHTFPSLSAAHRTPVKAQAHTVTVTQPLTESVISTTTSTHTHIPLLLIYYYHPFS